MLGSDRVVEMPDGYFRVKDIPTAEDLDRFYAEKYYQEEHGPYRRSYSEEEVAYFRHKTLERLHLVDSLQEPRAGRRMLDVGCGEGWALDVFAQRGWEVLGTDYTDNALLSHNPHLADRLLTGDLHDVIDRLAADQQLFDVVYLASVLEHVIDPERVLRDCLRVTAPRGILVVAVPHDFSKFQAFLAERGTVDRPYWLALPDHINYFTAPSLAKFASRCGWDLVRGVGDYPVEWHLLHPASNYIAEPERGPAMHATRVAVENFVARASIPATVELFTWLLRVDMGRQITALMQPASTGYVAYPGLEQEAGAYRLRPVRRADVLRLDGLDVSLGSVLNHVERAGGSVAFYEDAVVPQKASVNPVSVTIAVETGERLVGLAHVWSTMSGTDMDVLLFRDDAAKPGPSGDVEKLLVDYVRRELGPEVVGLTVAMVG